MLMLMMQNGHNQTPLRDTGGSMLDHSNSSSEGGDGAAGGPGGDGGQQQVTEAAMMNHHHLPFQHRQDAQSQMMRTTPAVLINDDPFMMNMGRFSQQLAARSAGMNNSETSSSFPLQAGEGGGLDNQKIIDDDVVVGGGISTTTAASRAMIPSLSMMNNIDQASSFATLTTTNTSPPSPSPSILQLHPGNHSSSSVTAAAERVSPGHRMASGGRQSMRMFLSKMAQQSVVKGGKSLDAELDMNLPFPVKLHYILSNPRYKECIKWLPHGRAWRIIKPKIFEKQVIPKFFRSAKYASFMRQVNGWAFTRITEGPDLNAYYHEMFLRGIPSLCFKMKRPPKVKSAAAAARNAAGAGQGTPDFYRIGRIAPLPKAEPFRPIAQEGTKGSSSSTEKGGGDDTPRYDIELLKIEDISPLRGGGVGGAGGSGSGGGMMVEWPDPEPSSSSSPSGAGRSSLTFPGGDPLFAGGGEGGKDSTAQQTTAATGFGEDTTTNDKYNEKTEDEIIRDLTKADIRYLAYQNQIILKHVGGGGGEGGSSSQHQPQPASSESNKSEQQQDTNATDSDNMSI